MDFAAPHRGTSCLVEEEPTPDAAPEQRPEGKLIADALARLVPKLSQREAARRAGLSETRWRQIVQGYQRLQDGVRAPVVAPAETLARMAMAVGVAEKELDEAGRDDAGRALAGMSARMSEPVMPARPRRLTGPGLDESLDVLLVRAQMQRERLTEMTADLERQEHEAMAAMARLHEMRDSYHRASARLSELQELIAHAEAQHARMRAMIDRSDSEDG